MILETAPGALVAVAQARSSGATTTALVLGLAWPRPALLAELDPAGGDLAVRFGWPPQPGLLSLAAAYSSELTAAAVLGATGLVGSLPTLVAPVGSEAAGAALASTLPRLVPALRAIAGRDVLVDCGRLGPDGGAIAPVLAAADLVVMVARPTAAGTVYLRQRLRALPAAVRARAVVVLVGDRPYPPAEVEDVVGVAVAGVLADDPASAALLDGGETQGWRLARSRLLRSARTLADDLAARLPQQGSAGSVAAPVASAAGGA